MTEEDEWTRTAEWAWAAGLYEGEGCLVSRRQGRSATLKVRMGDRDVVERFGSIVEFGILQHEPSGNPRHRDMWTWSVTNREEVIATIRRLYPLMGSRRRARMDEVLPSLMANVQMRRHRSKFTRSGT